MATPEADDEKQPGRRRFGVRVRTLGGLAVLLAVLLATSAALVMESWIVLGEVRRAEASNLVAGDLSRAALDLAIERGITNGMLTTLFPADEAAFRQIRERRTLSAASLEAALGRIAEEPDVLSRKLRADLVAAIHAIDAIRRKVDAEVLKPFAARDPAVVEAWLPIMSGFIEVARQTIGTLSAPVTALDAEMQTVLEARMAAFDLRNAAGERAAFLSGVLGRMRPISGPEAVLIGSRREATDLNWTRLLRLTDTLVDPRIDEALADARRSYFGEYLKMIDGITEAGLAGDTYPVNLRRFTDETFAPLASLDALIFANQALATDMLADRAAGAEFRLYASLAAAVAGSGVAFFMVVMLSRRVLLPIERITEAMRRLAVGSSATSELPVSQLDEIGDMSRAIADFRDAIIANESALYNAERFTHETIDALPSHVAVLDESGIIIATNRSWREFSLVNDGPRISHVGQNYLAVCDRAARDGDDHAASVARAIRSVVENACRDFETEYPWTTQNGRSWYRMRVSRFTVPGPTRIVVVHDDITGRKLAEERLRERNRLLELAEEMARTGHWRYELDRGAVRWSSEIYRIYGRSPDDFAPDVETTLAPYHPDDRRLFVSVAAKAIRTGSGFTLDLRLFRSDGQLRSVEVMAGCERGPDGRVAALFGVFRDISDRKKVEERLSDVNTELERRVAEQTAELSAREAYLRGILDNVAEIVMTIDANGRIESFNPAAERAFGYSPAEAVGRDVDMLVSGLAPPSESIRDIVVNGPAATLPPRSRELVTRRKDGTSLPVELTTAQMNIGGRTRFIAAMRDITERKRSERALRERAALLHRAQDLAGIGHWTWRRERETGAWHTGVVYSQSVTSLFGVTPTDLAVPDAEYIDRFVHPGDRAMVHEAFQDKERRCRDREPLEYRIVRPDGDIRHIREVMENVPDDTDDPAEVLGTIQDVTERKQAEMALRDSEARLRAIFDHAPVTISLRDADGRYLMVNQRFQELFDKVEADIVGRTPQQFYPMDFLGPIAAAIDQVRSTRSTVVSEEGAPTNHGDRRYLTTRFPIIDSTGVLSAIGSISVDVTEQRAAEAALRESEVRLRAIYDSEPECVALLAVDGTLLEINPAGIAMIEASNDAEALGRRLEDLILPEYREAFRDLVSKTFGGGSGSLLFEMTGLNETHRWMEMNAVPLRGPDGAITAMLGIARDVTGQRSVEEQLRQAQKMEAVGQLTGGVAHDFNNLLGVIIGNLDLLSLKLARRSGERELVERAIAAAERGGTLTQRLLAFARRQTLMPQEVDAGALVTELAQLLRRTIGERIDLNVEVDPTLRRCYVDPGQLETALLNLAINARDAMPDGGTMTITAVNATVAPGDVAGAKSGVAAAPDAAPGDYVVLAVADTGHGMNDDVRARAFEPFFTTKGVGKGSGLGLSMVYGFVEQSGGHVRLDSEADRGTVVSLFLKVSEETRQSTLVEPPVGRATSGDGRLVLVVEDDPEMLSFAVDALHRLGYRTISAVNASDALVIFKAREDIAVLFTDVMLPGAMDGFALAKWTREMRPDLPVLCTSGYAEAERAPEELLDGEVELLPKPYRISELGVRLERLLRKEARPAG